MLLGKEAGRTATGDARRRRRVWSVDDKRRIVAETLAPGASVSVVARRHDLNANMLFTWRRAVEAGALPVADDKVMFVPATITAAPATTISPPSPSPVTVGRMEIGLASGDRIIVGIDVDAAALSRVVKVLLRR
jgi:transposase